MEDEPATRHAFLKTTQEEDEIIIVDDDGKEEANDNLVLVGKIITKKQINMGSVGKVMQEIWKPVGLMTTIEKPDNTIIFKFSNPLDRKKILNDSPWHFNKHLMVLQEAVEETPLCDINLHECEFWVQIWNVPSTYLTKRRAENLGIGLGRITKIDVDSEGNVKEKFIRIRVGINVDKPLKRIIKAVLGGKEVTLNLKYEKLPDFCYACGKMNHVLSECETAFQYGPWLRAKSYVGEDSDCAAALHMRIVRFRSLEKPNEDDFSLELSKLFSYDEVVEKVAQRLGLDDASKIRLTRQNCYYQRPKPQPVKYRGVDTLSDMLVHYNQTSDILYYEVLDIPLPELERLKTLKVAFHHATKNEVVIHAIRLPKQSTVGDVINELKTKVEMTHPDAELRLLEVFYNKIYKIFPISQQIENINDQYWTIRAEEIHEEEKNLGPSDHLIHVYHFTNYTAQSLVQIHYFGDPFLLVIHESDTLADIKFRIQKKLRVPDEEFAKWKFAVFSLGRPEYLKDADIFWPRFQRKDVYGAWEQYLGLEHTDSAPKRSHAAN